MKKLMIIILVILSLIFLSCTSNLYNNKEKTIIIIIFDGKTIIHENVKKYVFWGNGNCISIINEDNRIDYCNVQMKIMN